MFLDFIGPSDFLPTDVYKDWSMEVMRNDVDWSTRQDFNDSDRQLRVLVSMEKNGEEWRKQYWMRKAESFRKVLEAAAKDFKVPLRMAKFSIKHPDFQLNIPVRSNSYIGDFRESLGLFQHGQNSVKLKLKRSDQSNEVHDDDYVI